MKAASSFQLSQKISSTNYYPMIGLPIIQERFEKKLLKQIFSWNLFRVLFTILPPKTLNKTPPGIIISLLVADEAGADSIWGMSAHLVDVNFSEGTY
ncbi:MAG: hypothetical protein P1V19_15360 [Gimesia sp.]|nr:hypothetical protein [Gimesia sp.]